GVSGRSSLCAQQAGFAERAGQKACPRLERGSFVSVSSPILACNVFTSTAGVAGSDLGSEPNTPAAPSRTWAFHVVIWLGWTSNCCASSASVFSPLTAARATFALNAGEWCRRGRLLIVSPALQPSWPPSGRNATYLTCSKIPGQLSQPSSV